jgi:hypothetical protein
MKATRWAAVAAMTIAAVSAGSPAFASGTPLSLTISPPTHTLPYKARTAVVRWRAVNEGTEAERVTLAMQSLTGSSHHCALGALASAASWGKFVPSAFTLLPGQSRRVTLRLDAPSSAHGTVRVLAHFTASAVGVAAPGSVSFSPSIGSQIVIRLGGRRAAGPLRCGAAAPKAPARAAPSLASRKIRTLGVSAAAACLAGAAVLIAMRRRRQRRKRRSAPGWIEQTYADAGQLSFDTPAPDPAAAGGSYPATGAPAYVAASRAVRGEHRKPRKGHWR